MTFLTILGVIEILCSFRLVLEGKAGKEIPKSTRLQFLSNNFALSEARQHPQAVENTVDNLPKVPRTKFLESHGFFFFIRT